MIEYGSQTETGPHAPGLEEDRWAELEEEIGPIPPTTQLTKTASEALGVDPSLLSPPSPTIDTLTELNQFRLTFSPNAILFISDCDGMKSVLLKALRLAILQRQTPSSQSPSKIALRCLYTGVREFHVLNLGAGVQSTCLFLLSREPESNYHFDVAIFADTGEEPKAVYEHLEYLQSLGDPPIWVRSAGKLGDDLMQGRNSTGQRFASIPAFTAEDHQVRLHCGNSPQPAPKYGMVRRQCTSEYKIQVIEKAIRRELVGLKPRKHMPKDVTVYQYFGITTDEARRAEKAKKRFEKMRWAEPVYPFLDMGWNRQDCIEWLKDRLPHEVPRSACVFCPYRSNREWVHLKETDPDGWERAVEIDNALRKPGTVANRGLDQKLYLHRSCIPLEQINFSKEYTLFRPMTNECQGMCGV